MFWESVNVIAERAEHFMNEVRSNLKAERLNWRRGAVDILVDVLIVTSKGAKKTDIVYKTNLNFKVAKKYLDFLLLKGLVAGDGLEGSRKLYRTTEKGKMFIKRHREAIDLIVSSFLFCLYLLLS